MIFPMAQLRDSPPSSARSAPLAWGRPEGPSSVGGRSALLGSLPGALGVVLAVATTVSGLSPALAGLLGLTGVGIGAGLVLRRERAAHQAVCALLHEVRQIEPTEPSPTPIDVGLDPAWRQTLESWRAHWPGQARRIRTALLALEHARGLPVRLSAAFHEIDAAAAEEASAVEASADRMTEVRAGVASIARQVERLADACTDSTSQVVGIGAAIEDVADKTSTLHQLVEASTHSVHQMGSSILQVAQGAERVQEMAETTASSVVQMDRSVQEVSGHALEAAALTERAHEGATAGRQAVVATIDDIEAISSRTSQAMVRLEGLVARLSEIGRVLAVIDEINDETSLLSLNAAIIAAQAGEQGHAFRVVANHVKTLSRRTAGSTQDIEALVQAIQRDSAEAVQAMRAGIEAVAGGVERSRNAGRALETIQDACRDASERVGEIARSTAEQSRNSKGVAEATRRTSDQIQQITDAIAAQRSASEAMLRNAERALAECQQVHRSTDAQRQARQQIVRAIETIEARVGEIGRETRTHAAAGEAVAESLTTLLEHARATGSRIAPFRSLLAELAAQIGDEASPAERAVPVRPEGSVADRAAPSGPDSA